MTSLIFTEHALERMEQRNISSVHVRMIRANPDGKIKQSFDKFILYKRFKDRTDNLIAIILVDDREVLTVLNNFEVKK